MNVDQIMVLAKSEAALRLEVERLTAETADINALQERSRLFGEIMAVLHRDGGHYLGERGPQKAYDDAVQRWCDLMTERDALKAELRTEQNLSFRSQLYALEADAALWEERARHLGWRDEHDAVRKA